MGLFWSLEPSPGQGEGIRLVKKDVTVPKVYHLQLMPETSEHSADAGVHVVIETTVEKVYMKKGVKRVPVAEGRLKGTIFVPEGTLYFTQIHYCNRFSCDFFFLSKSQQNRLYEGKSISNQPITFPVDRDTHDFHALFQYMF